MSRVLLLFFATILINCITGCTRYAVVLVSANDVITDTPLAAKIIDGESGQNYGITPALEIVINSRTNLNSKNITLIADAKCYETQIQRIKITKWAKKLKEARDAVNANKVKFSLTKETCP